MAETVPKIHVTDPQLTTSRPLSASPIKKAFESHKGRRHNGSEDATADTRAAALKQLSGDSKAQTDTQTDTALPQRSSNEDRPKARLSLDPLSQEIFERTGSAGGTQRGHRQTESGSHKTSMNGISDAQENRTAIGSPDPEGINQRQDKKKGVAFLARFMGNKKRDDQAESTANSSETGEDRPEGNEAEVFYQPVDNMGYSPRHPQPPPYIRVTSKYKRDREFSRLFLAQQLESEPVDPDSPDSVTDTTGRPLRKISSTQSSAVWALEVSKDGRYLASAGQDKVIRIWSIISSSTERRAFEKDEESNMSAPGHTHLSAPVFLQKPTRVFSGHTGPVLDLSWSKNNFLLSSSMDKTVRLWHVSRNECLCAFKHSDFVTSIQFHPKDDRFFLAGSLDSKLRLWSIPDKSVAYWNHVPDMITAVAFTPDGKQAMAGCLSGICLFYETEGLRYSTQIHVKSRTGKNAKGSKITGIKSTYMGRSHTSTDVKILITSNDSRIRLYNLRDKTLEMKFKGNENSSSQIHARFTDDARYVVCSSEDKKVYIWSTTSVESDKKDKWPCEVFEAHSSAGTVSIMVPTRSRQLLGASEDPLYDLCNPPPVTLVSRSEAESIRSVSKLSIDSRTEKSPLESHENVHKPTESPAYLARSTHHNGNIIITADAVGAIKIFRQDCAWDKRRAADPESFAFRRMSSMRRSSQNTTRSQTSLSRQGSTASSTQPRDRILSWRQSIGGTSTHSLDKVGSASSSTPALAQYRLANRSESPRKSTASASNARSVSGRQNSTTDASPTPQGTPPEIEVPSDAAANKAARPGMSAQDSSMYWHHEAWREGIVEQLQAPHRSFATTPSEGSGEMGDANHDSNTNTHKQTEKGSHSEGASLHVPGAQGRARQEYERKLSGFSALSSAETSDVEAS